MALHPLTLAGAAAALLVTAGVAAAALAGTGGPQTIALSAATASAATAPAGTPDPTDSAVAGLLDAATSLTDPAAALADSGSGTTAQQGLALARRICPKLPAAQARVDALETRLTAAANTPGSIAYLKARLAKAEAAGKADVATFLGARLTVRQDVLALLPDRRAELAAATVLCGKLPAA